MSTFTIGIDVYVSWVLHKYTVIGDFSSELLELL